MKSCLLCDKEFKRSEDFRELILLKTKEEWICKECKEKFEAISDVHCPKCFKDKEEKECKDCKYWSKKGNKVQVQLPNGNVVEYKIQNIKRN